MVTNKIQTGLRLSEQLYAKALAIAKEEQRSLNNLAEYALKLYVEKYEAEHGEIVISSQE